MHISLDRRREAISIAYLELSKPSFAFIGSFLVEGHVNSLPVLVVCPREINAVIINSRKELFEFGGCAATKSLHIHR